MSKIIEINNVQDYITELDKLDSDNYYFRGESSLNYSQVIASAFRPYSSPFSSNKSVQIDYQKGLKEYYLEIAHELLDIERENFLHYSQHHGLPTPLVDITSNPLTALFFSCNSNYKEKKSRVHLFQKNRFINLSLFTEKGDINLNNFFFDNKFTLQVYQKIREQSEDVKQKLLYDCAKNLHSNRFKKEDFTDAKGVGKDPTLTLKYILKQLFSDKNYNLSEFYNEFKNMFFEYFNSDFKFNQKRGKFRITLFIEKEVFFELHSDKYSPDNLTLIIIFLINEQSKNMIDKRSFINEYGHLNENYGVIFPLIVMHPSVKFERMKSQEGTFIYQLPHFMGNTKKYIEFSKIENDVKFIINDKKKIYKTLDKMGINQKTIFPDHDNIAIYLKSKYLLK